ncbi:unnamed protein product [Mytilus coruscus]|uniref:Uncharacterized protein n=1 Tax=Mytilus coruscus TaxID=42192 RepID=A0A6J8C007_MYTCO|nr:unnamed protein product [Mytilus coruscus]
MFNLQPEPILTINNSEKNFIGDLNEDDDSASDYQPSLDATLRQDHNIRIDLDSDDEDMDVHLKKGTTCKNIHLVNKWCSQPVLNHRLHSGDLLFSSALLISGCNFQKISPFARFLKLAIPLSVSYLKMQRTYLAPTLDEIWEKDQNQVFLEFKDKEHVLLGREFPNIKHSFDIWHGAKNLGKKVIKGVWCGMIHHVVNEHEWSMSYTDDGTYSCKHGPLCEEREKGWLKAGSQAHDAAIGIVMDKRFIKKIPYYLNCRSTAELENFQNLILKYASKRHYFNPVSYRARNLLAALDNNAHCQRQMMVNKDGSTRYYSKTGIQWSVYTKREDKDYHHVPTIIKTIVENRLQDPVGMNRKVLLDVNDPRRVSAVLAPTLPPSTADLVAQKISRFNKEDPEKTLDYSWTDGLLSV